jgi:hypothetical protein
VSALTNLSINKGEHQHSQKRYRGVLPSKKSVFEVLSDGKRFVSLLTHFSSSKSNV